MNRNAIIVTVLIFIAVAASLCFYWQFSGGSGALQLHGIVEIQEVRLGSKVGGRVEEIRVKEGEMVKPGQVLATLDERDRLLAQKEKLEAQKEEALSYLKQLDDSLPLDIDAMRAAKEVAEARLQKVTKGWRQEEIKMTEDEFGAAVADKELAEKEIERVSSLVQKNSAAKGELDLAEANLKRASSKYTVAQTKWGMVKAGGWLLDIDIAKKELKQAFANLQKVTSTEYEIKRQAQEKINAIKADLKKIEVDLLETEIRAPAEAIVEVIAVRKGDVVAPNQPIIRVLLAGDMWVKVFVPETDIGKVRLNQTVDVQVDSYPGKKFEGTVIQVGTIAEFTPRNVQSKEERRYQVFPVKIHVQEHQGVFKAGMAASVIVPVAPVQ